MTRITLTALCLLTTVTTSSLPAHDLATATALKPQRVLAAPAAGATFNTPLQSAWQLALATPNLAHATVSAYAYDLTSHRPLADIHSAWQLTPASIMKVFTSTAALAKLGPNFRYHTTIYTQPSKNGYGTAKTLYLVGGGDPWLEANGALDLEKMAKHIAASNKVIQQVVGVNSLFAGDASGTGWTWDDLPWNYSPNVAALTSERDQLNLFVTASRIGTQPIITINPLNPSVNPSPPFLQIVNHAETVAAGLPSTLTVTRLPGANQVVIHGDIPVGQHVNPFYSLHNPALLTSALFSTLLVRDGVRILAPAITGKLPAGAAVLQQHVSPPLSTYLQIQNTYSINTMAENLFRMQGTLSGDGSSAAATHAISMWQKQVGLTDMGVQVDGSGLSPLDEVSAQQVVHLLKYAAAQPWFTTFEHSLIHIGRTNQCSFLCGLMDQTSADGRVWIKTGNLGNQWNYAGYAHAQNGDRIAFAILIDGLNDNFYQQAVGAQDQMTVDTASWPNEPTSLSKNKKLLSTVGNLPTLLKNLPIPATPGSFVSGELIDVGTGRVMWRSHSSLRMEPALLPRLALLSTWLSHPAPSFGQVRITSSGELKNGTLHGSLQLSGHGNVNITSAEWQSLADQLIAKGIHRITGRVNYVTQFTGAPANHLPSSIPWEDFGRAYAPATDQLASQEGVLHIVVTPGTTGLPAQVTALEQPSSIALLNQTQTMPTSQVTTPLTATWQRGTNAYRISGQVAAQSSPLTLIVAAPHPALAAGLALISALKQAGITLPGTVEPVTSTARGTLLAVLSAQNNSTLSAQLLSDPSSALPLALFHSLGAHAEQLIQQTAGSDDEIVEPTGLGLENYMTAESAATLLVNAAKQTYEQPLYHVMSHNGLWMTTAPEQWSLSGYLHRSGHLYALVMIANGLPWDSHFMPTTSWLPK